MAHELETQNGVASFASFREPAWHGLGTVFSDEKTTSEMLAAANLNNWNVRLVDVEIPNTLTSDKNYHLVIISLTAEVVGKLLVQFVEVV